MKRPMTVTSKGDAMQAPRKLLAQGKMIDGEANDFGVRSMDAPNAGGEMGESNPKPMSVPKA
jgi:hypothetical protein